MLVIGEIPGGGERQGSSSALREKAGEECGYFPHSEVLFEIQALQVALVREGVMQAKSKDKNMNKWMPRAQMRP